MREVLFLPDPVETELFLGTDGHAGEFLAIRRDVGHLDTDVHGRWRDVVG